MTDIAIYEASSGQIDVRLEKDNVWLSLAQLVALFGRDKSVISRHIRNVFADGELGSEAVVAKFATTASDSKVYQVEHYNLDLIISVGYRVKSREGIRFRQWASRILKDHLTRGYTLDRQRLEHNARELETALLLVRRTLSNAEMAHDAGSGLAEIVVRYTQTSLWLQRYDEGLLTDPRGHPGGELPPVAEARAGIAALKADLMAKGQSSALFGNEREDGLAALSLLVAQSRPKEKDVLIRLIMNMLAGEAV